MTDPTEEFIFIRLKHPRLIPRDLIESIKGRTFTPEAFYEYQEDALEWPGNFLYVIADKERKIQGFFWAEINNLDGSLFINSLSVKKEYWHRGKIVPRVVEFLREVTATYKCPRVYWITQNSKFFEKHGWKRSKNVLMEYNPDKQEKDDGAE